LSNCLKDWDFGAAELGKNITLWTSTWAKGGVCGPAVYFVLTNGGDLQQRE
jgi:hypothetical protein